MGAGLKMTTFDEIRRAALAMTADCSSALQRIGRNAESDAVRDARNQLLDGRLTAVTIGEYKRGKSSLVGALVEDPALFPVNADIATSVITSIEYAAEEQITVFLDGQETSLPHWITRDQIADFVTEQGNPGNKRAARLLRIQTPSERLKDGLVLLDTPGAGGLNPAHTATTYAVLGSADVGIFVIDALTTLNMQELSILEAAARLAARMIVVVTKIDKVIDPATAVSNARMKLTGVLGPETGASIPVIPVSSSAKLDWLRTGDPDSLADSNFGSLETALWSLLGQQGGVLLLGRALSRAITTLNHVITVREAELVGLSSVPADIRDAAGKLRQQRDQLAALAQQGAGWRRALVGAFDEIRDRGDVSLGARLGVIAGDVDRQLAAKPKPEDQQAILADLERDMTVAWSALIRDARGNVAGLCDDIESMTGLSVNPGLKVGGRLTAFDSFQARPKSAGKTSGMSGLEALGRIGEVLSWVDPTGVLFFVSQIVAKYGASLTKTKKQRAEFESGIRDLLTRAELELRNRLAELLDSAEDSVTSGYERLIRDRDKSVSAAAEALHAGAGATARVAEVRDSLRELQGLRDRAAALTSQLTATGSFPVVT
jgi:Dynamin family